MRTVVGAMAVAGILVLSYLTAYLLRQSFLSMRQGIDGGTVLVTAVLTAYVGSSLAQALRRSGGCGWIVQRILAVVLLVVVLAVGTRGGGLVAVALSIGAAAVPVELYLAKATRRGGRDGA